MKRLNFHELPYRLWVMHSSRTTAMLALAAGIACASPSSGYAQGTNKPLVIARNMDLNSLDPHRSFCDTCQIYNSTVYETLLTLDTNNKLIPLLAASWEGESGSDQVHVQARPEGQVQRWISGRGQGREMVVGAAEELEGQRGLPGGEHHPIDTPDPQTVVVNLAAPNSEFLNIVSAPYMAVVNSKLASANGAMAAAERGHQGQCRGLVSSELPRQRSLSCSHPTAPTTSCV